MDVEIPMLPELEVALADGPTGSLTYLVTEYGKPFTVKGLRNKMRDWCDEAELLHCSMHGLRKAGATRAAENRATEKQLMAIFGWTTMEQASYYTEKANRKKLAGAGMKFLKPGLGRQMAKDPAKHHFIPKSVLENFTDPEGYLHFWRRGKTDGVGKVKPKELFVENHLYSTVSMDGTRDAAAETFFATKLDDLIATLSRRLLPLIRSGKALSLSDAEQQLLSEFFYFQLKRAPAVIETIATKYKLRELLLEESAKFGPEYAEYLKENPRVQKRLGKNARITMQSRPHSPELVQLSKQNRIVFYRITDARRSFIVGDAPGAYLSKNLPGFEGGQNSFLPIAHDVAYGFFGGQTLSMVHDVGMVEVRKMNEETARRATMIAGRSPILVGSLCKIPHKGVSFPETAQNKWGT